MNEKQIVSYIDAFSKTARHFLLLSNLSTLCRRIGAEKLHLAVFTKPMTLKMLNGDKTIESRFMLKKVAPFQKIKSGDFVFVKQSGGLVLGVFKATTVDHIDFSQHPSKSPRFFMEILQDSLAVDENFIQAKAASKYATIIHFEKCHKLNEPFYLAKNDMRGWCVIYGEKEGVKC